MGRMEAVPVGRKGGPEGSLDCMLLVCVSHPAELDAGPCERTSRPHLARAPPQRCPAGAEASGRCWVWGSRRKGPGPAGDERAVPVP